MQNMIVFSRGERYVIAIVLTLIITMVLAGCSGKNQKQAQGQAGQQSPAREGKKQETLLVYSGAGLRKTMDEIGRVFQENTDPPHTRVVWIRGGCTGRYGSAGIWDGLRIHREWLSGGGEWHCSIRK